MICYNKVRVLSSNRNVFPMHTSFRQEQERIEFDRGKRNEELGKMQVMERKIERSNKKELPLRHLIEGIELKIKQLTERLGKKQEEYNKLRIQRGNEEFNLSYSICNLRAQERITDLFSKYLPKFSFLKEEGKLMFLKEAFINAALDLEEFSAVYVLNELLSNSMRSLLTGNKDDFSNYISERLSKSTINFKKVKEQLGSEYSEEDVKNIVTLAFMRILSSKNRVSDPLFEREPSNYRNLDINLEKNFYNAIEELHKTEKEKIGFDDFIKMILTKNELSTCKTYVQCIYGLENRLNGFEKPKDVLSTEINLYNRLVKKNNK